MLKIIERITYKHDDAIENTSRKIEIPGKVIGREMTAGVMNLLGWRLVIRDKTHNTDIIIDGNNETDLLELKRLLETTQINISIQVPLNLPESSIRDEPG
ncbi:MAG: hypothetical protein JXR78_04690 [Victivallales bacterium]|nr:hypothetical protein [Victivallales bacterium]